MITRQQARDLTSKILSFATVPEIEVGIVSGHRAHLRFARNAATTSGVSDVTTLNITAWKGGPTALVEYSNEGDYIATHWLPTKDKSSGVTGAEFADGYGYDARVLPRKNALLTTSFTGLKNYGREFGDLVKDAEAMKRFGNTMAIWDLKAMKPTKILSASNSELTICRV